MPSVTSKRSSPNTPLEKVIDSAFPKLYPELNKYILTDDMDFSKVFGYTYWMVNDTNAPKKSTVIFSKNPGLDFARKLSDLLSKIGRGEDPDDNADLKFRNKLPELYKKLEKIVSKY